MTDPKTATTDSPSSSPSAPASSPATPPPSVLPARPRPGGRTRRDLGHRPPPADDRRPGRPADRRQRPGRRQPSRATPSERKHTHGRGHAPSRPPGQPAPPSPPRRLAARATAHPRRPRRRRDRDRHRDPPTRGPPQHQGDHNARAPHAPCGAPPRGQTPHAHSEPPQPPAPPPTHPRIPPGPSQEPRNHSRPDNDPGHRNAHPQLILRSRACDVGHRHQPIDRHGTAIRPSSRPAVPRLRKPALRRRPKTQTPPAGPTGPRAILGPGHCSC